MSKQLSTCPACGSNLKLMYQCPTCGLEMTQPHTPKGFDALTPEQYDFLMEFLRCQGNLKALQEQMGINYPNAKKRLTELLVTLELVEKTEKPIIKEEIDMSNFTVDSTSTKASEIIKTKLKECDGRIIVHTLNGSPCEIWVLPDGERFMSDKLGSAKLDFSIFDSVVEFLLTQESYRAKKISARKKGLKLGDPGCDETTLVGYIAKNNLGKPNGTAIFDPIFVLAAVLDWAGIAHNERAYLSLTAEYLAKL